MPQINLVVDDGATREELSDGGQDTRAKLVQIARGIQIGETTKAGGQVACME